MERSHKVGPGSQPVSPEDAPSESQVAPDEQEHALRHLVTGRGVPGLVSGSHIDRCWCGLIEFAAASMEDSVAESPRRPDSPPPHLLVSPASQLPVSGSLLSVQISGAYPCNTPCLTRERSEDVSTQCEKEGQEVWLDALFRRGENGSEEQETGPPSRARFSWESEGPLAGPRPR